MNTASIDNLSELLPWLGAKRWAMARDEHEFCVLVRMWKVQPVHMMMEKTE